MEIDGHKLANTVEFQWGIDATPDGGYALRILRAYSAACDVLWGDTASGEPPTNPLLVEMNKAQVARAAELGRAIAILLSDKPRPYPLEMEYDN